MIIAKKLLSCLVCAACIAAACSSDPTESTSADATPKTFTRTATKPPPLDENNIVSIALRNKDLTTLVKALTAADYVTSVAASGPLTVFAPTNAAFDQLPPETLAFLMKPENQPDLKEIIKYHATTSVYETAWFKDGQTLAMANGKKVLVKVDGDKITINGANVLATVRGSNGIVHVIDAVLLPPSK